MFSKTIRIPIYITFVFLTFELSIRFVYLFLWEVPIYSQNFHFLRFYPELRPFLNNEIPKVNKNENRILILGGSVVNNNLCNLEVALNRINKPRVFSLARYAHNSLDSRIKAYLISSFRFNYIFFYHGINDTRTNNCPKEIFRGNYDHLGFYRDVNLLIRHPELELTVIPYTIEFIFDKLLIQLGVVNLIPREYIVANPKLFASGAEFPKAKNKKEAQLFKLLKDKPNQIITPELKVVNSEWFDMGSDVKSASSFLENIKAIHQVCKKNNTKLIISPFAAYLPENYSLHRFLTDSLDYAEQRWPAELYGKPENVMKGIGVHNQIIIKFASENPDVLFFNFPDSIGRGKKYFNDICHLTPEGCEVLSNCLSSQIIKSCQKQ